MDQKLSYFSGFHFHALKSVFSPQRLVIPGPKSSNATIRNRIATYSDFTISENYKKEWKELMRIRKDDSYIPFSYHWPWTISALVKTLLPQLGLNLKNYLHVGQKAEFLGEYSTDEEMRYTLWSALLDLCPVGKDKMAIVSESSVHDQSGTVIVKTTDYSIVRNMNPDEMDAVSTLPYCNKTDVTILKNSFSKRPSRFSADSSKYREIFHCYDNIGIKYGCVSGALNTTHTFKTLSPLFGHPKPFLQGMCTGNIIQTLICSRFERKMSRIDMYFNNKLFTPQTVELRFDDEEFELHDEEDTIVSFGEYRLAR